ncbi:hypothetical protein SEA_LITTLEFELLA_4 [Gordonia phage LittleFella]|nr:hypothetical protein SEA_LITTLEFELLA_4 [Gordonia phage LittleFella]
MAFSQRKFKIRVQMRDKSSKKPRRITLVSQRRIVVNGKVVKAGAQADLTKPSQLRNVVAKAKPRRNPAGGKLKQTASLTKKNLKVGKF